MSIATIYERELHERLLSRDPVAPAELVEAYLDHVIAGLRQRCSDIRDDTLVTEAAIDAMLGYVQEPSQFNPERMGLLKYLVMSARGDLLNAMKRESSIARKAVPFSVVEDEPDGRNRLIEVAVYDHYDLDDERSEYELLQRVKEEIPNSTDIEIVILMVSGERRTAEYARILEIENLDKLERERVVKRNKDRLKKRLRRLGIRIHV